MAEKERQNLNPSSRQNGNLRYTVDQYRTPLIVITVGILLSIVSFILALNRTTEKSQETFMNSAAQETALIDGRFMLFQEKTRGVLSLFKVSPKVSPEAMENFVSPMLPRVGIDMMSWLPKPGYGGDSYTITSKLLPPFKINDILAQTEVKKSLRGIEATRELFISHPFFYTHGGQQQRYTVMLAPLLRGGKLEGIILTLLNLEQIYDYNPTMAMQPTKATIYLFDDSGAGVPFFMLGKPNLMLPSSAEEWNKTIHRTAYSYSKVLLGANGQRSLTFVPTSSYLLNGMGALPWVSLISSLLLTGLIGIVVFQQTRQRLVISEQVDEKTGLLLKITRALAEEENKLRAIFEHAADGLITINDLGVISSFNPACERILGYEAREITGQNIRVLIPELYEDNKNGLAEILSAQHRELNAQRKDGSLIPVDLSMSGFVVDDTPFFSGIIRDITSRRKAEEERATYLRDLEISNRELDDFAYISSHDLKEPLRGIQNFSKFLLEDYVDKLDADGKSKLLTIADLTKRMEDLLNALMHYSRLGRTALAVRETDLNAVISNITSMYAITLQEKHTSVTIPHPLPSIVCDHVRITEVFQNLIGNALKYNDKPESTIEIGYIDRHPRGNGERAYYVKDNGIGIKAEYLDTVFKIFKRLHPKNAFGGGTGSGLTIAKKIVNQHGGDMWAESAGEGKGTSFFFTIPRPRG